MNWYGIYVVFQTILVKPKRWMNKGVAIHTLIHFEFISFLFEKNNRPRFEFKTLDDNADIMAAPFDKNDIAYNIISTL